MIAAGVGGVGIAISLYGESNGVRHEWIADINIGNADVLVISRDILKDIDEDKLVESISFDGVYSNLCSTPIYPNKNTQHISQIDLTRKINHQRIKLLHSFGISKEKFCPIITDAKL